MLHSASCGMWWNSLRTDTGITGISWYSLVILQRRLCNEASHAEEKPDAWHLVVSALRHALAPALARCLLLRTHKQRAQRELFTNVESQVGQRIDAELDQRHANLSRANYQ